MKVLGIDYGTKHIGLALSDEGGVLASPWGVTKNAKHFVKEMRTIVEEESVDRVVIGVPTLLKGQDQVFVQDIGRVVDALREELSVRVDTFNEAFTTKRARQKLAEAGINSVSEHAAAATELLQNYLDRQKKMNS